MVFVKVRETYDLHTTQNKMSVIAIHTPKPDIIKKNYPGLLMQCKMYRPYSCDVRIACASILPLDPKGVGLAEGDVAPEDIFNPILYKAMSNKGMSQLEARINSLNLAGSNFDVDGNSAEVEVDGFTTVSDEFGVYYGLLSNTHEWRHANPQAGLEMKGLKPLVYEMVYSLGDSKYNGGGVGSSSQITSSPDASGYVTTLDAKSILGGSKPMPFINCTTYSQTASKEDPKALSNNISPPGFDVSPWNCSINVPWLNVIVGAIIVPPSRLHEMFYRMVVEWTIEFTKIRPLGDLTSFTGLAELSQGTHYQNYSYASTKEVLTGSSDSILDSDSCMVSANVSVNKVM